VRAPALTRRALTRGALATLILVASACATDEDRSAPAPSTTPSTTTPLPTPVQTLDIVGTDHHFSITPDPAESLQPGWTQLTFRNDGAEAHQVMFARIKEGVDMAELAAAGAGDSSGAGAIEFVDMIGGVSYIGPGQETTALVELTEGTVMAMCYVPDANGVAHALMGMTAMLQVEAPTDGAEAPSVEDRPSVVGSIEMSDDGYRLPDELRTGWYHVRNTDDALHEMALLRLDRAVDPAATDDLVADLAANADPDVELDALGGMGAISPGFDGYLHLELTPGDYLAVDFMPDPGEPRPHMLDGYHASFRVDA
jgi:hypothetical protein